MNSSLIQSNSTIILGLSGGPDSVYLLHQLHALQKEKNFTIIAAHLDHEWRKESGTDAEFCKNLCVSLGISCVLTKASELDFTPKDTGSKEDSGRQLRRYFFEKIVNQYQAQYIALAHHQDDQLETFFIRLARGSSLEGLCGIKEKTEKYIRPLLQTSKKEILNYLHTHNLAYTHDASNASDDYLRNRIRNKALPMLEQCDARFFSKTLETIEHLQDAEKFLQDHVKKTYQKITHYNETLECPVLSTPQLLELNNYLQKKIIQYWLIQNNVSFSSSNNFLNEIVRFINSKKGGSHQLGTSWKIIKKQSRIWILKQA
jgi:tRNA(Ile)-lysidine synthase